MAVSGGGGGGWSILTLSMSAIPHKHDLVWGGQWEKLPLTVTPARRAESCIGKMQTWLPPVGVCSDCAAAAAAAALSFR